MTTAHLSQEWFLLVLDQSITVSGADGFEPGVADYHIVPLFLRLLYRQPDDYLLHHYPYDCFHILSSLRLSHCTGVLATGCAEGGLEPRDFDDPAEYMYTQRPAKVKEVDTESRCSVSSNENTPGDDASSAGTNSALAVKTSATSCLIAPIVGTQEATVPHVCHRPRDQIRKNRGQLSVVTLSQSFAAGHRCRCCDQLKYCINSGPGKVSHHLTDVEFLQVKVYVRVWIIYWKMKSFAIHFSFLTVDEMRIFRLNKKPETAITLASQLSDLSRQVAALQEHPVIHQDTSVKNLKKNISVERKLPSCRISDVLGAAKEIQSLNKDRCDSCLDWARVFYANFSLRGSAIETVNAVQGPVCANELSLQVVFYFCFIGYFVTTGIWKIQATLHLSVQTRHSNPPPALGKYFTGRLWTPACCQPPGLIYATFLGHQARIHCLLWSRFVCLPGKAANWCDGQVEISGEPEVLHGKPELASNNWPTRSDQWRTGAPWDSACFKQLNTSNGNETSLFPGMFSLPVTSTGQKFRALWGISKQGCNLNTVWNSNVGSSSNMNTNNNSNRNHNNNIDGNASKVRRRRQTERHGSPFPSVPALEELAASGGRVRGRRHSPSPGRQSPGVSSLGSWSGGAGVAARAPSVSGSSSPASSVSGRRSPPIAVDYFRGRPITPTQKSGAPSASGQPLSDSASDDVASLRSLENGDHCFQCDFSSVPLTLAHIPSNSLANFYSGFDFHFRNLAVFCSGGSIISFTLSGLTSIRGPITNCIQLPLLHAFLSGLTEWKRCLTFPSGSM
ncbi:hypothetical protein PoB_003886800 [Plakobranchus ocellatus]|uniref:Uncharacterized protein n=1 Tax=Plakobranchus ocellatus TaxID=259542 RepID=A0AAV4AZS8_9GAST|nr:hypothetical protein PoB_003886800 [Plakobranchus ocellatus]